MTAISESIWFELLFTVDIKVCYRMIGWSTAVDGVFNSEWWWRLRCERDWLVTGDITNYRRYYYDQNAIATIKKKRGETDELLKIIKPIPEDRPIESNYDYHINAHGHALYSGNGDCTNYDYWDWICNHQDGCSPPRTLEQLLINVNSYSGDGWKKHYQFDNETIREWWRRYHFDLVLCLCECCHAAMPRIIFGWVDRNKFIRSTRYQDYIDYPSDDDSEEVSDESVISRGLPLTIRADSSRHAFYVYPDGRLHFINSY